MSKQYFIYDSDDGGRQMDTFNVSVNAPLFIRAAGLTEEVSIYQMVGECVNCKPQDVLWEPLISCGSEVTLGPENNTLWVPIPGKYALGDPTAPLTLTGDVNITGEAMKGVDPSLVGKCEPLLGTDYENPIFAEIVNQIPVETAMAALGCITDALGAQIGKVMLCKTIDEITGVEVVMMTAYYEDGTVIQNYTGPWTVCAQDQCADITTRGLTASW